MSAPRQVLPGCFYFISRRCAQRAFLLRPDEETNNAFLYCLIVSALRYGIDVMMMCAMSNHYHSVIYDRDGRYPEFLEHFHKLMARSQNCLRGRWENLWATTQTSVVKLTTLDAVIDKIVYTATNPVNDDLVERVHHWPGVNGFVALTSAKTLTATRPRHFFRKRGRMPKTVEMQLTFPASLGSNDQLIEEVKRQVREIEEAKASERNRTGKRVLGRRQVLQQSWSAAPNTVEPRRGMSPRVAGRRVWERVEALLQNRHFAQAYAKARAAWLAGVDAVFPAGTYWLRRFANVPISIV